jgi:site-specific DNA-methyltransferase (adenine-specific)
MNLSYQIYNHRSQEMVELADESVHLVVTSPPYNGKINYDVYKDDLPLNLYLELIQGVLEECHRVLVKGGRICINIANIFRKPYIPLTYYYHKMLRNIGFLCMGEIIWEKGASATHSTAWGSWQSQTSPSLRDSHEYVLVYCKEKFEREKPSYFKEETWEKGEFEELTRGEWTIHSEQSKIHPAIFPEELARRCIKLYSFRRDVVLDPFMGSGTTLVAAKKEKRSGIGYDVSLKYCQYAQRQVESCDCSKPLKLDVFQEQIENVKRNEG